MCCEDKVLGSSRYVKNSCLTFEKLMGRKRIILSPDVAVEKMHRMALEAAEQLSGDDTELIVIGIEGAGKFGTKGAGKFIATKITDYLRQYLSCPITLISLHLDKHAPSAITLSDEISFDNKNILLIDDVSNSGKTLLYALKPLMQFQPKRIQTLVLVERMHKLFPIKPDYVGYSIATASGDYIHVEQEDGNVHAVMDSGD